ncbi:MAG: SpoIIE family protein phosphatase, partial [Butyrivibrio sp.]|nr:SpoIIE family protein phosphatase [Butyrivibrio sp.]
AKLFLYTDGVPEATNAEKELFGTDRMLTALNGVRDLSTVPVLDGVRTAVDAFVKEAEQFDDLTMLCLEYRGGDLQMQTNGYELTVPARLKSCPM